MQEAINAYAETGRATSSPRELEASLLLKSAANLQRMKEDWLESKQDLDAALLFNRRLWTVFVSSMAEEDNQLPLEVRNNIASLGAFIFHHTITIQTEPSPDKLTSLIMINREIAAGLQAAPGEQ